MSKIAQLRENGEDKYLKTHVQAIDGIDGALVRATGNETILGTKNFKDGLLIGGKQAELATTYEKIIDYWDGTGVYLNESQTVSIPNADTVKEIILMISRYNANYGGMIVVIPTLPNVNKLKYDIPAVAWEGSASSALTMGVKRISFSKTGTSLIITGDAINTLNDANKKIVLREIGVRRIK